MFYDFIYFMQKDGVKRSYLALGDSYTVGESISKNTLGPNNL